MKLYHGSLQIVREPRIMEQASYRPLDFGTGFYTTSSREQAARWVRNRLDYDGTAPCGFLNIYDFNEAAFSAAGLKRLDFPVNPVGVDWLRFVMRNRRERNPEHGYDLVTGPVANDRVYTVISTYEAGFIDEMTAIEQMKTYRLANQFLFHTREALKTLVFVASEEVNR